jgi:hypothetical protein
MNIYLVEGNTMHSKCIAGAFLKKKDAEQCAEDKTKVFQDAQWPSAKWTFRTIKMRVLESYEGLNLGKGQ